MSVVIGLTTYVEQARWGAWDESAVLLPSSYAQSVIDAGGLPVLLPSLLATAAGARELVGRLDALVLTGGSDVDPDQYGHHPHPRTDHPRTHRDAAELALLDAALDAGMPVLCICRGLQLLNVARGGTLIQHLPDVVRSTEHAPAPGTFGRHQVVVDEGSALATALGRTVVDVATAHHQAIADLGKDLTITARAHDGTVEAVEDAGCDFLLGVQWHPEAGTDLALMTALVEAARAYSARTHSARTRSASTRSASQA